MANDVIELSGVTKMYGSVVGVENVDLRVEPGAVFGFLGPNGAGKTTTINMLLDFIRPTQGRIRIFGLDAREDSVEIRRRIGFLAGDMALDRGFTGWQELEFLGNQRGGFDKKYVSELAKRLDCDLHRKFRTLSRGNRQKVGLIAALMHKPDLLILDEPTTGLDPIVQEEFNRIILERKRAGATAFVSSHILSEVQEICDVVSFIRKGQIVDTKTVSQLAKESPKQFRIITPHPESLHKELKKLSRLTVEARDGSLIGTYSGKMDKLLRVLSRHEITDLTLENADLESTFMKYYEDEG